MKNKCSGTAKYYRKIYILASKQELQYTFRTNNITEASHKQLCSRKTPQIIMLMIACAAEKSEKQKIAACNEIARKYINEKARSEMSKTTNNSPKSQW